MRELLELIVIQFITAEAPLEYVSNISWNLDLPLKLAMMSF